VVARIYIELVGVADVVNRFPLALELLDDIVELVLAVML